MVTFQVVAVAKRAVKILAPSFSWLAAGVGRLWGLIGIGLIMTKDRDQMVHKEQALIFCTD